MNVPAVSALLTQHEALLTQARYDEKVVEKLRADAQRHYDAAQDSRRHAAEVRQQLADLGTHIEPHA